MTTLGGIAHPAAAEEEEAANHLQRFDLLIYSPVHFIKIKCEKYVHPIVSKRG